MTRHTVNTCITWCYYSRITRLRIVDCRLWCKWFFFLSSSNSETLTIFYSLKWIVINFFLNIFFFINSSTIPIAPTFSVSSSTVNSSRPQYTSSSTATQTSQHSQLSGTDIGNNNQSSRQPVDDYESDDGSEPELIIDEEYKSESSD